MIEQVLGVTLRELLYLCGCGWSGEMFPMHNGKVCGNGMVMADPKPAPKCKRTCCQTSRMVNGLRCPN